MFWVQFRSFEALRKEAESDESLRRQVELDLPDWVRNENKGGKPSLASKADWEISIRQALNVGEPAASGDPIPLPDAGPSDAAPVPGPRTAPSAAPLPTGRKKAHVAQPSTAVRGRGAKHPMAAAFLRPEPAPRTVPGGVASGPFSDSRTAVVRELDRCLMLLGVMEPNDSRVVLANQLVEVGDVLYVAFIS